MEQNNHVRFQSHVMITSQLYPVDCSCPTRNAQLDTLHTHDLRWRAVKEVQRSRTIQIEREYCTLPEHRVPRIHDAQEEKHNTMNRESSPT